MLIFGRTTISRSCTLGAYETVRTLLGKFYACEGPTGFLCSNIYTFSLSQFFRVEIKVKVTVKLSRHIVKSVFIAVCIGCHLIIWCLKIFCDSIWSALCLLDFFGPPWGMIILRWFHFNVGSLHSSTILACESINHHDSNPPPLHSLFYPAENSTTTVSVIWLSITLGIFCHVLLQK